MDPTAKAVLEAERDPLGRLPVGYEVDRSDPDVLVLRRSDGSFMTAFSRRGVRSEGVREAVEEELKRGRRQSARPGRRAPADAGTSPKRDRHKRDPRKPLTTTLPGSVQPLDARRRRQRPLTGWSPGPDPGARRY